MLKPLLELRAVTRRYGSGGTSVTAIAELDLVIHAGTMVAIVGPSGCGKSTLLNVLGALDLPSSGSYRVNGREVADLDPDALARLRRERFGFVFQRYQLLPQLDACENVELPASYAGIAQPGRRQQALALLDRVGLAERSHHYPYQLSGGQQQRVSVARALINGASVLLADEPTGALDRASGAALMDLLHELQSTGQTILIVTHDPLIAAHAERIIEMRDGRIVADRPNARPGRAPPSGSRRPRLRRARAALLERLAEGLRMALPALTAHPLRTLLTMLGIIIGVASVVSIGAIGAGAQAHIRATVGALAGRQIEIRRGHDWGDPHAAAVQSLGAQDVAMLAEQAYLEAVSPLTEANAQLRRGRVIEPATVNAVGAGFLRVRGIALASGRGISDEDLRSAAQIAIIDPLTRQHLFAPGEEALGQVILVANVPYTVVGTTDARSQDQFGSRGLNVAVPATTAAASLFGRPWYDTIVVRLRPQLSGPLIEIAITRLLLITHGSRDFFTHNMDTLAETMARTTRATALMLSLIGAIALLVGGIGVMNIMLVSVAERTREIGVRMAVGARPGDILGQFLTEAVIVCLIGGGLGIAAAHAASPLVAWYVHDWHMVFSTGSLLTALAVAAGTGVTFGWLPAWRASRLLPTQALARE
jgi:macrolide transport system ATP-binding/permease protein